jgi:FecR-like protein
MKYRIRWHLLLLTGAWLAATTAASAWAQTPAAGRFLSVTGDVRVVGADGAKRAAQRGGEFREGETIVTGASSLAQARTADGGLISVRSDTEMKLDKFAYAGEKDSNASFLVSLVKGGFRTITGLIGRANRDGYRVTTPSATIGIRGTHYELVHVLPQAASPQAPAGTYNRVYDGITTFQNKVGTLVLVNRDQTAFIPLPGNVPPVLVVPPAPVFGKPTPVPRLVPQSSTGGPAAGGESRPQATTGGAPALVRPATTLTPLTTTISPIDSTTTIRSSTTTTLSPTTSTLSTTTLTSPTTSTLSTTTLTSPTTSTLSTTTLTSPTTSTLSTTTLTSPTLSTTTTLTAPTTTTISPTTTTISPTTTTILK